MAVISYRKGATASHFLSWDAGKELKIENGELRMDNGCPRQMKQNSASETMIQRYALATPNPSFISQLSILHSQLSILNYPFSIVPGVRMAVISDDGYDRLLHLIGSTLTKPRRQATALANIRVQETDRQLSQHLAEFEQKGPVNAEYGAGRTSCVSHALTLYLGKGYSRSDVKAIRRFDWLLPKSQTPSDLLSWDRVVKRWHLANWGIGCKHTSNRTVIQRDALAPTNPSFNSQLSILHSQLSRGFAWQ